jgi:hypothetical protein
MPQWRSQTRNIYTQRDHENIRNARRLLLQVAGTHLAGVFVKMLDQSAQLYAKADMDSFVPES